METTSKKALIIGGDPAGSLLHTNFSSVQTLNRLFLNEIRGLVGSPAPRYTRGTASIWAVTVSFQNQTE
jgi:hypothetical protein